MEHDDVYNSILNTKRLFQEISIEFRQKESERLFDILERHGVNIECLTIAGGIVTTEKLVALLNLMPNLESIQIGTGFGLFGLIDSEDDEDFEDCFHGELQLNLRKLKKLSLYCIDSEIISFFNKLKEGCLEEFELVPHDRHTTIEPEALWSLKEFASNQCNIKNLTIDHMNKKEVLELFMRMQLTHLTVTSNKSNIPLSKFFSKQSNLIYLDILELNHWMNDGQLAEIFKLRKLETLKLALDFVSLNILRTFDPLKDIKQFKYVTMQGDIRLKVLNLMAETKFEKLEKLTLRAWNTFPAQKMSKLLKNCPSLKKLKISGLECRSHIKCVFDNCSNLNWLFFEGYSYRRGSQIEDLITTRLEHVQKFILDDRSFHNEEIISIAEALPNLIQFDIHAPSSFSAEFLQGLLKRLPKLENLAIRPEYCRASYYGAVIKPIKEFGKNLKYFRLLTPPVDQAYGHDLVLRTDDHYLKSEFWTKFDIFKKYTSKYSDNIEVALIMRRYSQFAIRPYCYNIVKD